MCRDECSILTLTKCTSSSWHVNRVATHLKNLEKSQGISHEHWTTSVLLVHLEYIVYTALYGLSLSWNRLICSLLVATYKCVLSWVVESNICAPVWQLTLCVREYPSYFLRICRSFIVLVIIFIHVCLLFLLISLTQNCHIFIHIVSILHLYIQLIVCFWAEG